MGDFAYLVLLKYLSLLKQVLSFLFLRIYANRVPPDPTDPLNDPLRLL